MTDEPRRAFSARLRDESVRPFQCQCKVVREPDQCANCRRRALLKEAATLAALWEEWKQAYEDPTGWGPQEDALLAFTPTEGTQP